MLMLRLDKKSESSSLGRLIEKTHGRGVLDMGIRLNDSGKGGEISQKENTQGSYL